MHNASRIETDANSFSLRKLLTPFAGFDDPVDHVMPRDLSGSQGTQRLAKSELRNGLVDLLGPAGERQGASLEKAAELVNGSLGRAPERRQRACTSRPERTDS